jgi:hypothetical protein
MNAAVLIAALAGVQCHVAASTTRDGITTTAPEILRYSFLSHGKFVDQSGEVGPMAVTRATITLGKEFWTDADGSRFGAATIDRKTGRYSWTGNGPTWSATSVGKCRTTPP